VGRASAAVICGVSDVDILITDDGIEEFAIKAFQKQGVEVIAV
jgi:DeoR/GlpR family transcriptional regulator of sugar metabolism